MDALPALPSDLPSISRARLPATYEGAKSALAHCTELDECQDWADRAEALASYAKQAQDDDLRKMADRIQARAIRRCGELLSQIQAAHGANQNISAGNGTKVPTRTGAARDAGLSRRQQFTATRIARIPDREFEDAVEAAEPPTVTALADQGRIQVPPRTDHLNGRDVEDFRHATALLGLLHHIGRTAPGIDVEAAVRGLSTKEAGDMFGALDFAEQWIERVGSTLRG